MVIKTVKSYWSERLHTQSRPGGPNQSRNPTAAYSYKHSSERIQHRPSRFEDELQDHNLTFLGDVEPRQATSQ